MNVILSRMISSIKLGIAQDFTPNKEECLSRLILFGEVSLRHALTQYVKHFHHERHHQGKGNVLLFPVVGQNAKCEGPI